MVPASTGRLRVGSLVGSTYSIWIGLFPSLPAHSMVSHTGADHNRCPSAWVTLTK